MKQIFIIAPYFPPSSLPPAQRVRLLVSHAASLGYYPTVFTIDPSQRDGVQDAWMAELAGNKYNLVTVKAIDKRRARKFGFGDFGLRMMPYLFFSLRKHIRKQKPDFILYPVPPWFILLIAPLIKMITAIPYGIDFIDPWVHKIDKKDRNFKNNVAHWISTTMEKYVCKNASIIYSVSTGINKNLLQRYPVLKKKIFVAVPYGAEPNDFDSVRNELQITKNNKIIIRYIGVIWFDCYAVLDGLMPALASVEKTMPIQIEFIGTSYLASETPKPQLGKWITQNHMISYTTEIPSRVTYREAVELTLQSDILLLIGGMEPYYAASKLMGLLVSKKPFVAFVHEDSFPAKILKEINYPYVVSYSNSPERWPTNQIKTLTDCIKKAIIEKKSFFPVDLSHPLIQENTAFGMTKKILEPINDLVNE